MFWIVALAGTRAGAAEPLEIRQPVTDPTEVLSPVTAARLTEQLVTLRERTGTQLAVLVVATTSGEPIEDYALRTAAHWAGGAEGRDDGALYVLAVHDRRMRLEVGYGLEAQVTDQTSSLILATAVPHLRAGDYDAAVLSVVDHFAKALDGRLVAEVPFPSKPKHSAFATPSARQVLGYVAIFFFVSIVARILRKRADTKEAGADADGIPSFYGPPLGSAKLWLPLTVLFLGTLAGLLDLGWFHYWAGLLGAFAGWRFMWAGSGTLLYLFFLGMFGAVPGLVSAGFTRDPLWTIVASLAGQTLATFFFATDGLVFSGTSFSGLGSGNDFERFVPGTQSFSSTFGTTSHSSSSFGTSSFGSSSFGGGGGGYSGGGGSFGGGGASSSW